MINLSSHFYLKLAQEILATDSEIVQFDFRDNASQIDYNVIFVSRTQSLTLLIGKKYLNHNFSLETLSQWIQIISSTES